MDRVRCAQCGEEHDLSELEPTYNYPDAYFEIPLDERAHRTSFAKDAGRIRNVEDTERRHFLRVLLPMPIRGEQDVCAWGVWVEVSGWAWQRAYDLWDDPAQSQEPPFSGQLANALKGYEGTLGLPGQVRLTGPTTPPEFHLEEGLAHPFAIEQQQGVYPERVVEWLMAHAH